MKLANFKPRLTDFRILTDPDGFFRERWSQVRLEMPVLMILFIVYFTKTSDFVDIFTVVIGVESLSDATSTFGAIPGGPPPGMSGGGGGGWMDLVAPIVATFLLWLLTWLVNTIVLYSFAMFLRAESTFRGVAKIAGYGFAPVVVSVFIFHIFLPGHFPAIKIKIANQIKNLQYIFLLWSGSIWMFGLRNYCDVELKKAAAASAVLVILTAVNLYTGTADLANLSQQATDMLTSGF
ncbi:MAG: YIP1 family protein [Halobacteria archaeon]